MQAPLLQQLPPAIPVTETRLTVDVQDPKILITGYAVHQADRAYLKQGGDVSLFVCNGIPISRMQRVNDPHGYGKATCSRLKLFSDGSVAGLLAAAAQSCWMNYAAGCASHRPVLGDFNAPHVNWTETKFLPRVTWFSKEFLEFSTELALRSQVRRPMMVFAPRELTIHLVLSTPLLDFGSTDHPPPFGSSNHSVPLICRPQRCPPTTAVAEVPKSWRALWTS